MSGCRKKRGKKKSDEKTKKGMGGAFFQGETGNVCAKEVEG